MMVVFSHPLTNLIMKSVLALAMMATLVAADGHLGAKAEPPTDDAERFEKKGVAKTALITCLTTKQGDSVVIGTAKTDCKDDSAVVTAFTAWSDSKDDRKGTQTKYDIIDEWYNRDPDVKDTLQTLYPITDVSAATADDIKGIIGEDADVQDIAQYKEKEGRDAWAEEVKTCIGTASNVADTKACITGTTASLCAKTDDTIPCCAAAVDGSSLCTAEDGMRAIEEAADDEMSEKTKACSKVLPYDAATVKTCREALRAGYAAKTGKTVDAVGKYYYICLLS
jgi:hypothetical protein